MKKEILTVALVFSGAIAQAESFFCKAENGGMAMVTAPDLEMAMTVAKEMSKNTKVKCEADTRPPFVPGTMADLGGKKWGFQGLASNETYLVFEGHQLLHIQDCGPNQVVHKFNAEVLGPDSLKLSGAGVESRGRCYPTYAPGFEEGSVIQIRVGHAGNESYTLLITDRRPSQSSSLTSLYKEMN